MILPIYTFGNSVLRKIAEPIDQDYPGLKDLIKNMYDTMVHAEGVGLADAAVFKLPAVQQLQVGRHGRGVQALAGV